MAAELATSLASTEEERLEQAEALVRGFCGWHIASSRTETLSLRGPGYVNVLSLPSLYVTDVSTVTIDGTPLLLDSDYAWSTAGILTHSGYWGSGDVEVTLTHGYEFPPAEVTAIVQAVAQRAIDNPGSLVRKQVGPFSDSYSTTGANQVSTLSLLDAEKEALRRYRIPGVR